MESRKKPIVTSGEVVKTPNHEEIILGFQGESVDRLHAAFIAVSQQYGKAFRADLPSRSEKASTVFISGNCRCAIFPDATIHITAYYGYEIGPSLFDTLKKMGKAIDHMDKVIGAIQKNEPLRDEKQEAKKTRDREKYQCN